MPQPINFQTLFVSLQNRYPFSSLVTELVQVHDGLLIVRACVKVNDIILATGMASAPNIEQAEDRARLRVLEILGIQADAPIASQVTSSFQNGIFHPESTNEQSFSIPLIAPIPTPYVDQTGQPESNLVEFPAAEPVSAPMAASKPKPLPKTKKSERMADTEIPATSSLTDYPELAFESAPIDESFAYEVEFSAEDWESSGTNPSQEFSDSGSDRPIPTPPQDAVAQEKAIAPSIEEPDDLSSLIALTDIEMDRIGWSKQEGRAYIKQTYGKSTRQRLDVNELMDFLNYLRALPSVNGI